ncbi:MAG TPA: hypothetical protein VFF73_11990 [Planctomycetota bacterium]|nr:hypothetical protein [Planctomycetota bacterium]
MSGLGPERRLFLATFLVASVLVVPAFGGCENRTLDLLRALSAGRLSINAEGSNTVDRAVMPRPAPLAFVGLGAAAPREALDREWVYSGAAPGHAFLLIGPYLVAKRLLGESGLRVLLLLLGAALPHALGAVGVRRAALAATGCAPERAQVVALLHAFGTIALAYGARLYAHSTVVCLVAWSLATVFGNGAPGALALGGLLAGVAVSADYSAGLPAAACFLLALERAGWRGALAFALGALPPALLLASYHTVCFGAPWETPYHHRHAVESQAILASGYLGFVPLQPGVLREVLLGTRCGWLSTQPIALVGLAGLALEAKKRWARIPLAAACAVILTHSLRAFDWDGCAFGPRYSIGALPFVALGLPRGIDLLGRALGPVAGASVFLSWLGTSLDWMAVGAGLSWNLVFLTITGPYTILLTGPLRVTVAGALAAGAVVGGVAAVAYLLAVARPARGILALVLVAPVLLALPAALRLARGGPARVREDLRGAYVSEVRSEIEKEENPFRLQNLLIFARFLGDEPGQRAALERLARTSARRG